ncbi:22181_t:CDS:2, partial [Gigaspora margarita]
SKLSPERINKINKACVKAFVICGIPWTIIKNPFFVDFLKTLCPGYTPPSHEVLSGHLLSQEIANINLKIIQKLNYSKNLTIEPLENLRYNSPEILSQVVISILRSCAFFDDVRVLVFILGPVKKAITILESYLCNLADCFCELIYLGTSINKLSLSDHSTFQSYWAHRTFRELLLAADKIFKKMDKTNISRQDLLYQMKLYHTKEPLFDILYNYLVQLALKLFSIVPHAARYECIKMILFEIDKVDLNESEKNTNLSEETDLLLNNILTLNRFEDEFEENDLSMDEDYYNKNREKTSSTNQLQEDIN